MLHPGVVKYVHMDGETVPRETIDNTYAFLCAYCLIAITSMCLIALDGFPLEANLSATMACLNNIGPGLNVVGPVGNYGQFSDFSKVILILDMLLGRLEIFPIFILFVPRVWKRSRA